MRFWFAGLLLLGACSNTAPEASPTQTPEPLAPTTAPSQRYESIDEMLSVLGAEDAEIRSSGVGNNAATLRDFMEFGIDGGDESTSIFLFDNRKQRDLWLSNASIDQLVYGPNWMVVGPNLGEVFEILGGTVTAPVPSTP